LFGSQQSIPSCTHQLLKAFLRYKRLTVVCFSFFFFFSFFFVPLLTPHVDVSKTPFFSFTVSGDELSLILDDELMADFPEDVLAVHSSQWKSVQVDFGSLGFSTCSPVVVAGGGWCEFRACGACCVSPQWLTSS
jgi:hypothetical protein